MRYVSETHVLELVALLTVLPFRLPWQGIFESLTGHADQLLATHRLLLFHRRHGVGSIPPL